jgi:hypothetical protein
MSVEWAAVRAEMVAANGFVEGPGNANPWGPEQGVRNAAYCSSFAHMVPYHHGYRWPANSQFGDMGDAYCPYAVQHGAEHGEVRLDHASRGGPADLLPGDQAFFDWAGDGVADHVETVIAVYADGTYDTVGANTGRPEGVHAPIRRDRKYLLARRRPSGYAPVAPLPAPVPARKEVVVFNPPVQVVSWCLFDSRKTGGRALAAVQADGGVFCEPKEAWAGGPHGRPYWGPGQVATGIRAATPDERARGKDYVVLDRDPTHAYQYPE